MLILIPLSLVRTVYQSKIGMMAEGVGPTQELRMTSDRQERGLEMVGMSNQPNTKGAEPARASETRARRHILSQMW